MFLVFALIKLVQQLLPRGHPTAQALPSFIFRLEATLPHIFSLPATMLSAMTIMDYSTEAVSKSLVECLPWSWCLITAIEKYPSQGGKS